MQITPSSATGAKTAERAPTTIVASPREIRARSSRRSASVSAEWRTAIRSPNPARKPLQGSHECERATRRRPVVVGEPQRELDQHRRQLLDHALDRHSLYSLRRSHPDLGDDASSPCVAEAHLDHRARAHAVRHLVGELTRERARSHQWIDRREGHAASVVRAKVGAWRTSSGIRTRISRRCSRRYRATWTSSSRSPRRQRASKSRGCSSSASAPARPRDACSNATPGRAGRRSTQTRRCSATHVRLYPVPTCAAAASRIRCRTARSISSSRRSPCITSTVLASATSSAVCSTSWGRAERSSSATCSFRRIPATSRSRSTGSWISPIDSTISSNGWARPDSRPSLCGSTRILRSCGLAAGGFDDQLGTEAEEEPCEERPGDEDLGVDAPKNREELDDDVEDRAGRDRKERDLDPLVRPRLSDRGANEGRSAADRARQGKKPPTRAFRVTCHGADDAEALGRVVGCEADHERDGKAHFACSGRLADRQAFGEVVDPDPGGDEQAEPLARREPGHPRAFELGGRGGAGTEQRLPALPGHPAVVVDEAHQAGDGAAPEQEAEPEQVTPFVFLGRLVHGLPAVGDDVEEEKEEDPCGKGHEDGLEPDVCVPVAAERQAEEDRHAGDPAEEKGLAAAHVRVTLQNLSGLRCARWRRGIPSTSTWRRCISWPFRSANTGP